MADYIYTFPDSSIHYNGTPFTLGNTAYPGNWLDLATDTQLSAIGVVRSLPAPFSPSANDVLNLQYMTASKGFNYMYNFVLENVVVNSFSTFANTSYPYGTDRVTRENIQGTVTAITAGIEFPDPLPWTPKGYTDPVALSHTDLVTASGAILMKVNEMYGIYFIHKANIMALSDWTALSAYDFKTGYPTS